MRPCVLSPVGMVNVSQGVHNLGLGQDCYDTGPASRSMVLVQAWSLTPCLPARRNMTLFWRKARQRSGWLMQPRRRGSR